MLGITNAGIGKKELEEMLYQQTLQSVLIATGSAALTSTANLYQNTAAAGVYPDSTFEYVFTGEVTTFDSMFKDCTGLTSVSDLDTHNGVYFNSMFHGCSSLTSVCPLDTSNGVTFGDMFLNCSSLVSIPDIDTSNVSHGPTGFTGFAGMFYGCSALTEIPDLDFSDCDYFVDMFAGCTSLTTLRDNPYAPAGHRWNIDSGVLDFGDCPLNSASILKVFNGLLPAIGATHTVVISSTTNGYLSADDKAIAENKGWTVTVAA